MRHILTFLFVAIPFAALPAQSPERKRATVKFLQELQVADGGFVPAPVDGRLDQDPHGSLRATSAGLRALHHFGGEPKDKKAASKFVKSCWDAQAGGFSEQPGGKPDVFTTAVGLMAVDELKLPMKDYAKAIEYLGENAKQFEDIRMAAAGFEAFENGTHERPKAPEHFKSTTLSKLKNAKAPRDWASCYVTAERLAPIRSEKPPGKIVAYTLTLVERGKNADGGFGKDDSGISDLESTYRVMRLYHMYKVKPDWANELRAFIGKCRNTDGGYGVQPGKPSQVGGAYYAGSVLHWLNEP